MGATLSKLWGSLKAAVTGTSSAPKSGAKDANGTAHDLEANSAPANTTTKSEIATTTPKMGSVKKYEITEPWIKLNCSLGEGPFYEEKTHSLRFLDVQECRVHTVDLNVGSSSHKVLKTFDFSMGCTADVEGNDTEFIFGGKYGYGLCNRATGETRWIKKVWSEDEKAANKPHRMRGNDGAVDSQGRFWVGFMFDPLVDPNMNKDGAVFRLDPDMSLHRPLDDITIPNGTTWNKADNTMFFADSPFKTIYQFEYDVASGAVKNRRPFFVMPEDNRYGEGAVPDGHCIDEEGFMWTALHGGSHVLRISPQGDIVAEIKVPTKNPTCPCFAGTELIITSAGGTDGPDGKGLDEFAGSVFKIDVGVRGLKRFKWKGGAAVEGGKEAGQVVGE